MKKIHAVVLLVLASLVILSCQTPKTTKTKTTKVKIEKKAADSAKAPREPENNLSYLEPDLLNGKSRNPIITHVFTADPTARVFEGRVYLYASHDRDKAKNYDMNDYHVFSSDDLVNWQDHGVALKARDFWASMLYAPDCVYDEVSKQYLLYFPNGGDNIGVASSDKPAGPFKDAIGKPLIKKSYPGANVPWCFDPGVLVDDDGQSYLYFGGGMPGTGDNARVIRLNKDMISLMDDSATTIVAPDYFEAPFTFKRNGKYYFTYSTNWENGHGIRIDYMMSDNPMTGFEHKGVVIQNPPKNEGNNNHHSIVEYQGSWYVFYHSRNLAAKLGIKGGYQRSVNFDRLTFADNGEIIQAKFTNGDVEQLKSVNAFDRIEAELMAAQSGVEVADIYEEKVKKGAALTELSNGSWSAVSGVDFGEGANAFTALAAAESGGKIELWIDGGEKNGGTMIGVCEVPNTGGPDSWQEISCNVEPVNGVHNLYLIYKGAADVKTLFKLDYYSFN